MLEAVVNPRSVDEARAALAGGSARLVAGGTIVMPAFNYGSDDFSRLVSLRHAGLSGISVDGGRASVGAATPLSEIEDNPALGFLRDAIEAIASPTVRNLATAGGNLFASAPYGDFAACLIALDASARIVGRAGERVEKVETLVASAIAADEIVTRIGFSVPEAGSFRFLKAMRRGQNSGAIVTVAAVVSVSAGAIAQCRIALGGVGKHALRAPSVEAALTGKPLDRAGVEAAARRVVDDIEPFDDAYASAWYRRRVTPVHVRRALIGE